jgi:hypothetical protein
VGGGGVSGQTNNPAEVVAYRNQYRRLIDSPEFREFTPEQQGQIRQYHDWLNGEIDAHYAQPHGGIIPADIASATEGTLPVPAMPPVSWRWPSSQDSMNSIA